MMKTTFWITALAAAVAVYFTDLSSDSLLLAGVLPAVTVLLLIVLLVVGLLILFRREQPEYSYHVTIARDASVSPEPPGAARRSTETVETVVSSRTVTYVDGEKVDDTYEEQRHRPSR